MRLLALAVLLALAPFAAADSEQGATVGLNLGFVSPGLWDLFWLDTPGGATSVQLTWAASLFPGADYDLRLYAPGALDDGVVEPHELVDESVTRTFAPHAESLSLGLPAGRYVAAVCPFQTQAETYTLAASPGNLAFASTGPGYETTL